MGVTPDPTDPRLARGVDDTPRDQAVVYLVLSEQERAQGFVEPVRESYLHARDLGGCGAVTRMNRAIAETYARTPEFYGATYCVGCRMHRPVGEHGEFVWVGAVDQKVGTRWPS